MPTSVPVSPPLPDAAHYGPQLGDAEFEFIRLVVGENAGIVLGPNKRQLVQGRLARRLRELGLRLLEGVQPDVLLADVHDGRRENDKAYPLCLLQSQVRGVDARKPDYQPDQRIRGDGQEESTSGPHPPQADPWRKP